jgi:hypothetical protein
MNSTHEIRDLQMLVEGYRSQALAFEKALDEANWRLKTANETGAALIAMLAEAQWQLAEQEAQLKDLNDINNRAWEVANGR